MSYEGGRIFEGVSGASQTKAVIDSDVSNKLLVDILIENAQLCDKDGSIIQKINTCKSAKHVNIPGSIKQKAAAAILSRCSQDAQASTKIAGDFGNAIAAEAAAKSASGAGLLVNGATSNETEITTKVTNDMSATIKSITSQSCNITVGVDQSVDICGEDINIGGIEQTADIQVSGDCDQVSKSMNDISAKISNDITAKATSGTDMMAGIVAIVFLFVIMAIISAVIYFNTGDSGRPMPRFRPQSRRPNQSTSSIDSAQLEKLSKFASLF
jgi:hypothetical protein